MRLVGAAVGSPVKFGDDESKTEIEMEKKKSTYDFPIAVRSSA